MHCQWLPQFHFPDMYYEFASYVHHIASLGTFGINTTYVNWGEQTHTDETGNTLGTFNSFEMAVGASYGTELRDNLAVGSTAKFIYSKLAPYSSGEQRGKGEGSSVALDLGVLWNPHFVKRMSFGLNLQNLGPKMAYIDRDQADPLPTNLKCGFAYRALSTEFNKLTFLADFNKILVVKRKNTTADPSDDKSDPFYKAIFTSWTYNGFDYQIRRVTVGGGTEYCYNDQFFVRAGYFYEDIGKRRFATFGAGIKLSIYQFDFGYISGEESHPLNDTMRFSLSFVFNNR
jgi:long-subunit fatty acid transport protein